MKMKKIALACGIAMVGFSSLAAAEVSMNIGVTSNYLFRGVTQTNDDAAVSGGVDWSSPMGLYAGAWASNVDFGDATTPSPTPYELDLYGGYSGELSGFGYDLGLIYYTYDSDADANYLELGVSGSWKFLKLGVNYTLDGDANDKTDPFVSGDIYYYGQANMDLPDDYSVGLTLGRYSFDNNGIGDTKSYSHYQFDLTKSAGDFGDVTLTLSDTDLDNDDAKVLASWSKSF